MAEAKPTIAIIGGTGALGTGLALRWASAGYAVIIGSRKPEDAANAAELAIDTLSERGVNANIEGLENSLAANAADIVVLSVPFSHLPNTLDSISPNVQNKIVVDTTVPLQPPKVGTVQLPEGGASAVRTQLHLGENVRVVSAFQTVAANKLQTDEAIDGDVLVCGDFKDACENVIELVEAMGVRGLYAGPLANSAASEALTSVLITINRQFKCHAGIKVVGTE